MKSLWLAGAVALATGVVGCGGADMPVSEPTAIAEEEASVPVLTQSHFSKDPSGSLTEEQLQAVLGTAIDLQFPARIGVVPLARPFEPGEPVSLALRGTAARHLARGLVGSPHFSHVSNISTELPHAGGIEGLRALAARYRLRYLMLYSERVEDDTHLNGWAWLYPTIIGMFIAPGVTVASHGVAQVDLLDVRTGTILFTVEEPFEVDEQEWMVGAARAHRSAQSDAAATAATHLSRQVVAQANALVAFAEAGDDHRTRIIPAPIATNPPPAQPPPPVVAGETP